MIGAAAHSALCLTLSVSVSACLCTPKVIHHDEEKAGATAQHFAEVAFVSRNSSEAWSLLAPDLQKTLTQPGLAAQIEKMHPGQEYPLTVLATDFEPLPGQPAMNIYVTGTKGVDSFYYRLTMLGNAASGYQVAGLGRGSRAYPSTPMVKALPGR